MWFTEDPWPPMIVAGVLGFIAVVLWTQSKRAIYLAAAAACVLLGAGLYFIEQAIVTPREQVEQLVVEMASQYQRKDPAALDHFSKMAPQLRVMAAGGMALINLGPDLRLTDFRTAMFNENSRAICHFRANATVTVQGFGNAGYQPARLELTWQKEGGEWKVVEVRRLHPITGEEMSLLSRTST